MRCGTASLSTGLANFSGSDDSRKPWFQDEGSLILSLFWQMLRAYIQFTAEETAPSIVGVESFIVEASSRLSGMYRGRERGQRADKG